MKKSLLALLSVFILLFTACDSWMQDDDFYSDIENDVKVANAPQISVYVRYALTRQGKTDPDGTATFKVEIPHEISATTETEYGFVRWAAFTTDFVAPGDNQSLNKDVYYIDDEDYNERLLPHELTSPVVVFEDAKSPTTKVTINQERNDIFLVPLVAMRPAVSLTIPAKGSSGVVRNMSVRINFTKPMDIESFKNEAGKFDKITITQGTQSFTADGDIEINSEDITDYFEAPVFSKNKKMITLKFNAEHISEGYASQSSVNITISKDVKDIYGFTMTDDDKISFSVGSNKDTLAPRITQLTAGRDASSFNLFQGVYKDAETINNVGAGTKMTLEGAANAPADDIESSFYNPFVTIGQTPGYLVKNNVVIRVLAEDISGSGSGQSQTGIETDVAMIGMRAYHMFNADGTPSSFSYAEIDSEAGQTFKFKSSNYVPQTNLATSVSGSYKSVIEAINDTIDGTDNDFATDKGCLLDYDLSDMPDGLIRIDVAAVDMVQNSGFTDGGAYSPEYGNAWASLFVIKDTTPPDAAANSSAVHYDSSATTQITSEGWFNEATFNNFKILGDSSAIADSGHSRLRAPHDFLKWNITANGGAWNTGWQYITADRTGFPLPASEGSISYTYTLMDYLGNVSSAASIPPFKYDGTASTVGILSFVADPGYSAGEARESILDHQILYIPITETMSGLKSIELKVNKNNGADYASPLSASSSLVVSAFGEELTPGTHYTLDSAKKVITFTNSPTISGFVTIKGLKISDANTLEEGSYSIDVVVKDAAAASGAHESHAAQAAIINIDNQAPVINQIYVPDLKATKRLGSTGTEFEYWQGSQSSTDVYVTFTEASSGAKIFDFAGSSVRLTNSSALYKLDPASGAWTQVAATVTVDSTGSVNKIEVNLAQDARTYFAAASGQITAKITNVNLAAEGSASSISLRVHDTATNVAASPSTSISSNEGTLNLAAPGLTGISSFKYDSGVPSASGLVLKDRKADKDTANHFVQAEAEFTNEGSVNANITLTQSATNSGIISLTISGDATFTSSTEIYAGATYPALPLADTYLSDTTKIDTNGNYLNNGGTQVLFDISADGKTASFKTAAGGHLVLGTTDLAIKNLALTSGDDLKSVTIYPKTICGLSASTGGSDTIKLDTIVPAWNGKGLYSHADSEVNAATVYPHSVDPAYASTAYGIGFGTYYNGAAAGSGAMEDLYFYRASNISIGSDVSDTNFKITRWIASSDNSYLDNAYCYGTFSGVWTAIALDNAGNQSIPITYNLVVDDTFATTTAECNALYDYTILYKPDGAFIHRNTIDEYGHYNYVIKNDNYQIRVKLGGNAVETGEEAVAGGTPAYTSGSPYSRKDNTPTSSKIEKYYVTTTALSALPAITSSSWKDYTSGASNTFNGISTSVDSNGTIIINLPNESSNPIILYLLDACGNSTSILVRASSTDSYGIYWRVDNEVGAYGEIVDELRLIGTSQIIGGGYGSQNDVMFYRGSVLLKTHHLTESCRFSTGSENTPSFPTYSADPSFTYTMKSRIIAWTDSTIPDNFRDYFGNNVGTTYKTGITPPPASSNWCFVKQANSGNCPIFYVQNNFPQYDQSELANPSRYKLYLILEDTVGNYEIRQIRSNSSGLVVSKDPPAPNSGEKEYWFFDNTPPEVTPAASMTYNKINTISGTNYYSNNSYVNYTVTDYGSGVYSDGVNSPDYTSFGSRTSVPVTYSLNGKNPTSGKLVIPAANIYDYAGNSPASNIELNNGASTEWVRLENHPVLESNAAVAVNKWTPSTPNLGLTGNTAASANTTEGGPGGQKLELTAKWGVTGITVRLYTTTAQSNMLGWVVSESPLNVSESDFYTSAQVSSDVTWDSSNNCWKYEYSKDLSSSVLWQSKADKYFYPVNKAGLIGQNPVLVHFKNNNPPTIVNATTNGFDYTSSAVINASYLSSDAEPTPFTIKVGTSGSSAINYTTSAAKVTFTTTENPTVCRFISAGTDGNFGTDDDAVLSATDITLEGTGPEYTVDLPANVSGTKLGIQLSRGAEEDSGIYELKGPAGNNLWTYDNDTPEIDFGSTPVIKSGSSAGAAAAAFTGDTLEIKYIQNENAFIGWSLTNAADIAHYQWKRKTYSDSTGWSAWSGWTDFDSSYAATSGLTFPAPESKTEYKFRLIDTAGNISNVPENTVKLQRDQWAPEAAGGLEYHLRAGETNVTTPGMDIAFDNAGTVDEDTRVISYSKTSTNTSYYIDRIWIKLSNVTDKRDNSGNVSSSGIERSGIQKYEVEVYKNGTLQSSNAPSVSDDYWEITGLNSNDDNTVYTYELKVVDNLGQTKTLKTFRTNADGTAPDLALKTGAGLVQKTADSSGSSAVDCDAKDVSGATDNGIYYLNTNYAIINLTKTATDVFKYQVTTNGGTSWTDITPVVDTTGSTHTVKYIFTTPETATSYQFRAIDGVGNASEPTDAITIQKDTTVPANSVTWAFKKGSATEEIGNDFYNITADTTESKSITYNGNQMNKFEFNVSTIASASDISGIRRYWLKIGDDAIDSLTASSPTFSTSTNTWAPGIATTGSAEVSYKIWAEDWAGNTTAVKEFKLTNDVVAPEISFAASDIVQTMNEGDASAVNAILVGEGSSAVYYLNKAKAVINLATSSTDIKEYKVSVGGAAYNPITSESGLSTSPLSYTFATPTAQTTYSFKVIDNVGNESSATGTVKLVQDITAPAFKEGVSALSYAVQKEDGSAATPVSDTNPVANYTISTSGTTTTITYNPGVVKKLSFNALSTELTEYLTSGANSGFDKLYYKLSTGTTLTAMTGSGSNEIELGNDWNGTCYIYAKDKAGNQTAADAPLMTLVLVADSTGPVPGTVDTNNNISGYSAQDSSGGAASIHIVWDEVTFDHGKSNVYTAGTKVLIPVSDANASVVATYSMVTTTGNTYLSNPNLTTLTWSNMEISEGNYIIPLPETGMTALHNRIALFFKDSLGNISGPYYLGNPTTAAYNWWIREVPFDASNITISKTASGTEYTVTITAPVGAIIKSISLGGDLTWATGGNTPPQGDYTHPVRFGGYEKGAKNGKVEAVAGTAWKGEDVSTASGGEFIGWINNSTITLKTWAPSGTAEDTLNIIINGDCTKNIFASMVGGTGTDGIDIISVLGTEISGDDGTDSYGTSPKSRAAQFFNSVADVFARNRAVEVGEQSGVEKPTVTEKKAKKAAKKAKKTANKVVSTGSTTAQSAMSVGSAEILAQNETSSLPESTMATETAVSEIAGVTEKASGEAEVVSIRPTGYSSTASSGSTTVASADTESQSASAPEAAADKHTPSRSASIVIMLAILSSFGAVWYLQRNRKK